jgi:hypothetical protein
MKLRIESRPIMGVFVVHWGAREIARLPDIVTLLALSGIVAVICWIGWKLQ